MEAEAALFNDTPIDEVPDWMIGRESVPLRQLNGLINDKVPVSCILDTGSQFVAMRRDLWEKTGTPLSKERAWTLEAANGTKSQTLGLVDYVTLTFGQLRVALRVQVVDDAPFELLLGRPFYTLTNCNTQDFTDGEQHLTVTDPQSKRTFTIPTTERTREPRAPASINMGFGSLRTH